MYLDNKVVIITGASSGIGKALALILADQVAGLVLLSRNRENLESLAEILKPRRARVLALSTDVTKGEMVSTAISAANEQFGRIDILINCAGVGYFGALEKMSSADVQELINANVIGLLQVTREVIPYLRLSKGMVVNISSGLSKRALPYLSAYAGTKSMVDAMSEGLRLELKPDNIHVLNYCPPETDTPFFTNSKIQKGMENLSDSRKKVAADKVAKGIVRAIKGDKREVVEGRFLEIMNFFAPKLLDIMFYKAIVEKHHKRSSQ